jgi:Cdc6-like AAA superfamily ATPase
MNDINPDNLTPELRIVVCTLLAIQHCGNRPAHVVALMEGLYDPCDLDYENICDTSREFASILSRMHSLGWITKIDGNGCVILTDTGDEAATDLKNYYEAAGILDFSLLP